MGSVANLKLLSPVVPETWAAPPPGWHVAEVSPAAREAAARATGMTTGAWLTHVIEASLIPQMPLAGAGHATAHPAQAATDQPMPAASLQALVENIQGVAQRLDEAEGRTDAELDPLAKRISDLSREFSELTIPGKDSAASLELATVRIAERIGAMEEAARTTPPRGFGGLIRRLWPTT